MRIALAAIAAVSAAVLHAGPALDGAAKLMKDGNYAEAYAAYTNVVFADEGPAVPAAGDRAQAVLDAARCVRKIARTAEVEPLLDKVRAVRGEFPVRLACVQALGELPRTGRMVKGAFERRESWGGWFSSVERDRVRRLAWLEELMPEVPVQSKLRQRWFWNETIDALMMNGRDDECAWKLVELTRLDAVPEVASRRYRWWRHDFEPGPAPVDADGRPVFHAVPQSWSAAKSDGERWRFANAARAAVDETGRMRSAATLAAFAKTQFGVGRLRWETEDVRALAGELAELPDDETITRVANGIQRFKLPDGYDYIRLFGVCGDRYSIAVEYETRYRFAEAAALYLKEGKNDDAHRIIDPGVRFEGEIPAASWRRRGAFTVVHRNTGALAFSLQRLDVQKRLSEVREFVKSGVATNDWQAVEWELYSYLYKKEPEKISQYLAGEKREWRVPVAAASGHFDTREEIEVPFDLEPGDYLLEAAAEGGGRIHSILRVARLAVVGEERASPRGASRWRIVDAETGEPAADVKVDVFRWTYDYREGGRKFIWDETSAKTDADGLAEIPDGRLKDGANDGFALCTAPDGSISVAYARGGAFYNIDPDRDGRAVRCAIITDRPAYRPGDTVKYKLWARGPADEPGRNDKVSARKSECCFYMSGENPDEPMLRNETALDRFGGASGEFKIPADAKLGEYCLQYGDSWETCTTVRVEEYRKPEFEVAVDVPEGSPALGEKVTATVCARYYFGEPVRKGRADITVTRTPRRTSWHPPCRWDWLYGAGCDWYFYDSDWYAGPGRLWIGRVAPWTGFWQGAAAPETVVTIKDAPLGENGEIKVSWDTSFVRKMHGDSDQEYKISVSVIDESRRTIDGSGSVVVRAEPFRVFVWTDRPRYRVGDAIEAKCSLDGLGEDEAVSRKWRLYRLDAAGGETEGLETGPKISASKPGQYRISCEVTDAKGRTREGSRIITILGAGDDGLAFRCAPLELVPDKRFYAPGETVRLSVCTDRPGSTVFLCVRGGETKIVRMPPGAKSDEVEIKVEERDRPNFHVEAWTVSAYRCHREVREIMVPPADKIGKAAIEIDGGADGVFKPGGKVTATVRVFDHEGRPCDASAVMSVYDKAIDAIAGGSNVKALKQTFWGMRRYYWRAFAEILAGGGFGSVRLDGDAFSGAIGLFGEQAVLGRSFEGMKRGRHFAAAQAPQLEGALMRKEKKAAAANDYSEEAADAAEPAGIAPGGTFARSDFADTAYWNAALEATGTQGVYRVEFKMPDDITGWNVKVWSMCEDGRVAEAACEIATKKELMLRMQTPRFMTEGDELTVSANVHNYSADERRVEASIECEADAVSVISPARQEIALAAGGEARVDWRVKAARPGRAKLVMRAAGGGLADGVEREIEVQEHSIEKTESHFRLLRGGSTFPRGVFEGETGMKIYRAWGFPVPDGVGTNGMSAVVEVYDTLAAAVDKAIPYLKNYEYECTEQTMNRFVPAAVARRLLKSRGRAECLGDIDELVAHGLKKLEERQNTDGGWGWFWGPLENSYEHMTATVVRGLAAAKSAGVEVSPQMLERGREWLAARQRASLAAIKATEGQRPRAEDVLTALAMLSVDPGMENEALDEMLSRSYDARLDLPVYAQALLGLALDLRGEIERRDMVARNLWQHLREDAEKGTAWIELGNSDSWWRWYGSDIEAQASALMLFLRTEPHGEAARGLALYLADNRKARTHWTNTRDTALAIEALVEYCEKVEDDLEAKGLATLRPVYVNAYLTYKTAEEPVGAAGLELKVGRAVSRVEDGRSVPLADGSQVKTGDILEIRLDIDAKNDCEYVLVEDRKGAGFEPVDTASGYKWLGGGYAYVEFRERKTGVFLRELPRGSRSLTYRVRVETPGDVHVLPASVEAMYAPRLRGNSAEARLEAVDP